MEISIAQVRNVMEIIESGDGDGWYCWEELKKWLAKFEAAQQGVQSDVCPSCAGDKQVIGEDGTVWVCGICGGTGKRR